MTELQKCIRDIYEVLTDPDLDTALSASQLHSAFDNQYSYEIVCKAIYQVSKKHTILF